MPKRSWKSWKTTSSQTNSNQTSAPHPIERPFRHRLVLLGLGLMLGGCTACLPKLQLHLGGLSLQVNRGCQSSGQDFTVASANLEGLTSAQFLAFGGGGAPHYNEIALEKNMLYFQRSLQHLALPAAPIFFANGDSGQATIRYLDRWGRERFKVPNIPNLRGAATAQSLDQVVQALQASSSAHPLFFYFSGHGFLNRNNPDNNAMILWEEDLATVQSFATQLDSLPAEKPVVVMMAQCFSGSFTNLIYEGGDPENPVALRSRCGFFATTKHLPSVGCTPEVNEADYRDYSSSFFAGLTGIDRTGQPVASADYNGDGRISYSEAHAFAKIDEETSDRPLSTREAWLQEQLSSIWVDITLRQSPIQQWIESARPEQVAVIRALGDRLGFNTRQSFVENIERLNLVPVTQNAKGIGSSKLELKAAYLERLRMELLNVSARQQILKRQDPEQLRVLKQLQTCEDQSPSDRYPAAALPDSVS